MDDCKNFVGFGLIMLMGLIISCSESKPNPEMVHIDFKDNPALGSDEAPIKLIIFTDYECSYCKQFLGYLDGIRKSHIESGKLKVEIWDFPIDSHEHAFSAAICSYCAFKQGSYWEMHSLIYESQNELSNDSFRVFATQLGLDMENFDECLKSDAAFKKVQSDISTGKEIGVDGTPAFVLNGKLYSGTPPEDVFLELINSELEKL